MEPIVVDEYEKRRVQGVAPTAADLAVAESEEVSKRITLRWLRGDALEIEAGSHVGVVDLECASVHVRPKLVGSELGVLQMLDYAAGLGSLRDLPLVHRLGEGLDLRDLVCLLLTRECDRLLRHGLRRDYLRREESLPVVRGRLLVERQVTHRFGMLDRLECRYDERSGDILDNRLCGAALHLAARTARDTGVRAHARRLAADFAAVCALDGFDVRAAVERLTYHRANEHYREAHRWARMLLEGTSFRSLYASAGGTTHAFLIDMNTLFEDFVTRLLRDAFAGSGVAVRAQLSLPSAVRGYAGSYTSIQPDVQLVQGHGTRARRCSVDAKYKLYADKKVATSDLYQSFVYAQAVGNSDEPPAAFIVYPADRDVPSKTVSLHRHDGAVAALVTYVAVNVPLVLRPGDAREALFDRFRGLMGSPFHRA
ncbi:hypothetical protein E1293_10400 [Actinomadura darangshiensis]|uniref:Restriction endonuclease n=1 Tax=Actinomadura darangshiensis TaxID=705336 RepID=A0A4R5BLE1_9ACTN|nr:hypothetical protein [Actinomadura darangshiensis]TDD85890.1 hypothetical protein E1293_10400 [Actinomadura darangshiensis]